AAVSPFQQADGAEREAADRGRDVSGPFAELAAKDSHRVDGGSAAVQIARQAPRPSDPCGHADPLPASGAVLLQEDPDVEGSAGTGRKVQMRRGDVAPPRKEPGQPGVQLAAADE